MMLKKAKDIKGIKKTVSTKAKLTGLKYHKTVEGDGAYNFKKIYFSKVKALLGFDQSQVFFSGAAPLMEQTADYFLSLDIRLVRVC